MKTFFRIFLFVGLISLAGSTGFFSKAHHQARETCGVTGDPDVPPLGERCSGGFRTRG